MRHPLLGAAVLAMASAFAVPAPAQEKSPYPRRNAVVEVVEKATPSIVMIRVPRKGQDDLVGTGVVFDERGLIVTNCHVVGDHKTVNVRLHGDVNVAGQVLFREPRIDLAIVKVASKTPLVPIEFGVSKNLKVGERVVAIGHPFGYANTVTSGVVSALGRSIQLPNNDWLSGIVQTDAKINPGNSGGPLLNLKGELVALNVAIRDGAQGIAFAINADMVKTYLNRQLGTSSAGQAASNPTVAPSPR
jgi:serine protease Do